MKRIQILRSPETGSGSTETEATVVRERVAKHDLIDSSGAVVETEEEAAGIRYTLLKTGKSFEYKIQPGTPAALMLAIFGAKTLATNEASQSRQKDGENADQLAAISERFSLIDGGKWVDKTGGIRIDLDTLAQAVHNVLARLPATDGKTVPTVDAIRVRLDDAAWRSQVRSNKEIDNEYTTLKGRPVATVDEIFAGIGA